MFGRKNKKKREETSLWASIPEKTEPPSISSSTQNIEPPATTRVPVEKAEKRRLRFHFPRIRFPKIRYMRSVAKVKRGIAFVFGIIYFLSGLLSFPSPVMAVGFISAYMMIEYVWVTRKLAWLSEGGKL